MNSLPTSCPEVHVDRHRPSGCSTPSAAHLVGRLRYRQLALLVALGEHGNLHRAAAAVHIAQPSATKILHDLERLWGCRLFERLPRGMSPTELGKDVLAFARRALAEIQRFNSDLERKRLGSPAQLLIGIVAGSGTDHVGRAVAAMTRRHPEVSIRLIDGTSEGVPAQLLAYEIDLGLGHRPDPSQHPFIAYEKLGSDPLCLVVRPGHRANRASAPARDLTALDLSALHDFPWILPPFPSPARLRLDSEFAEASLETPARVIESQSPWTTLQIVLQSDAIAVLPEAIVRGELDAGLLARLPLALDGHPLIFGVLTRQREPLTAATTEFIELLRRTADRPVRTSAPLPRPPSPHAGGHTQISPVPVQAAPLPDPACEQSSSV